MQLRWLARRGFRRALSIGGSIVVTSFLAGCERALSRIGNEIVAPSLAVFLGVLGLGGLLGLLSTSRRRPSLSAVLVASLFGTSALSITLFVAFVFIRAVPEPSPLTIGLPWLSLPAVVWPVVAAVRLLAVRPERRRASIAGGGLLLAGYLTCLVVATLSVHERPDASTAPPLATPTVTAPQGTLAASAKPASGRAAIAPESVADLAENPFVQWLRLTDGTVMRWDHPDAPLKLARASRDLVAEGMHGCVVGESEQVTCFEANFKRRSARLDVPPPIVKLVVGDGLACAVGSGGTLRCARFLDQGAALLAAASSIEGVHDIVDVALDWQGGLAVQADGTVMRFGRALEPAPVHDVLNVAMVYNHNCYVMRDHRVRCGDFGKGDEPVELRAAALDLRLAEDAACARLADETVWCWTPRAKPEPIGLPGPARALLGGGRGEVCARLADRRLLCWRGVGSGHVTVSPAVLPLSDP